MNENMIKISIGKMPGCGFSTREVKIGTNLLALDEEIKDKNRFIFLNHQYIEEQYWEGTRLQSGDEVIFAPSLKGWRSIPRV